MCQCQDLLCAAQANMAVGGGGVGGERRQEKKGPLGSNDIVPTMDDGLWWN